MKRRSLIPILAIFMLNSCIVKSLYPFFTKESIHFDPRLVGTWQDDENTLLEVFPFRKKIIELEGDKALENIETLNKKKGAIGAEFADFGPYGAFEQGYLVVMTENGKEAVFGAIPFKIKDQTFLDFILLHVDLTPINSMAANHLLGMHTLIKVEFNTDNSMVQLKWFAEEKLNKLIEENRVRIRYASVGNILEEPRYLLTASSEELSRFIEKFMDSKDEDKWASEIEYDFKKS